MLRNMLSDLESCKNKLHHLGLLRSSLHQPVLRGTNYITFCFPQA